jgi:TPR repeat protein
MKKRPFAFVARLFSVRSMEAQSSAVDLASTEARDFSEELPESVDPATVAAENGDPVAQNDLGLKFAFGAGLHRRDQEARKWLRRAAQQGYAEAQFNLGNLCESVIPRRQISTQIDEARVEAYVWFCLAAAQGHTRAEARGETLNLQLTDAELAEGNRRVHAFQSHKEVASHSESVTISNHPH